MSGSGKTERTFMMIKPDAVQRGLVPEIMGRFQKKGYKLVGLKMIKPTEKLASEHYEEHKDCHFFPGLVKFVISGPCVAMVWEGRDIVRYGRRMIGETMPLESPPGTIRGDFGIDAGRKIIHGSVIHGSDRVDAAQREIALWFKPSELIEWTSDMARWIYE